MAVLHFHEIADAAVGLQHRARAQLGEGSNGAAGLQAHLAQHGEGHLHVLGQGAVFDQAAGPDAATIADHGIAAEVALGFHQHIPAEAGAVAEGAAGGIGEGDAFRHPVAPQAVLQNGLALGELQPVVDAVRFLPVLHLQLQGGLEHGHGVGEIELALVVVGGEARQHLRQAGPMEAVDAGVGEDLAALARGAVALFHDGRHPPLRIGEHPPVTGGIAQAGGEHGDARAASPVTLQQGREGFGAQQGHIAVEHQQIPLKALQGAQQLLHRMARAVLRLLWHEFQIVVGGEGRTHPLGLVPHDQDPPLGLQGLTTLEHPLHQGGARQGHEHLGQPALHARPLSSGQDGDGKHRADRQSRGNLLVSGWARPGTAASRTTAGSRA